MLATEPHVDHRCIYAGARVQHGNEREGQMLPRNNMQANADLMNNMIDLMQAGACPHTALAAAVPQITPVEVRQVEMAARLLGMRHDSSIPDREFVSKLRSRVLREAGKLERD